MKINAYIFSIVSLVSAVSSAETSVLAKISGTAKVSISGVVKHRHSLDCYVMGKGDDYQNYGSQNISFDASEKLVSGSGSLVWAASISSPFRATPRRSVLTSTIKSNEMGDQVQLVLQDRIASNLGKVHEEKCRHTDGMVSVKDATIQGTVRIQYKVPKNVWAVQVVRTSQEGVFSVTNTQPIGNVFNAGYDKGKTKQITLWVKPGQILEQVIEIPEFVGSQSLGEMTLEFKPLGVGTDKDPKTRFLNKILVGSGNPTETTDFVEQTMRVLYQGQDLTKYTQQFSLSDLKKISDRFFALANGVYPNAVDGMSIKTASALAAFQISQAILTELSGYCQDVDVYLPFTGEKQKVLGLRAASFWLTRSMNFVNTYSYDPLEVFIRELKGYQDQGKSPADIAKNKELKTRIQKTYMLLTETMSLSSGPFNRAYVDFNKMAQTFPRIQSLGPKQSELLTVLEVADAKEAEFLRSFTSLVTQLNAKNTKKVNYDLVLAQIADLRQRKIDVALLMRDSVRILSVESSEGGDQVMTQILDLLNHQVNIFKNPVAVPFFDGVRAEFYNANIKDLDSIARGCFQIDGVN